MQTRIRQEGVVRVGGSSCRMRPAVAWGVGTLVGFMVAAPGAGATEPKIGYLDVGKIFTEYQRTKDSDQALEQKSKQKQAELEGRFNELKRMRQNLELLNDKTKDTKAKELEDKSDEFQRLKTQGERDLLRERNQAAKDILDEIQEAVKEYAKTNGYALVLDARGLVYADSASEITDAVLRMLNDRYAARSGKAPKR